MKMPTSKSGGAKFRGPTSSHEYNVNEDEKYLELIELNKQANDLNLQLKEAHQVALVENATLHNYVNMLENHLSTLDNQIKSLLENSLNGTFFKSRFVQDMTTKYPKSFQNDQVTTPRCEINLQHRFTTIPKIHDIPKTHIVDDKGNYVVPSSLKVNVSRSHTKGTVSENNVLNAFNGDNVSYWRRSVTYDSPLDIPANGEDAIIEIELPTKLVNNLNINTISLHPHPERGIEIKSVELHYNNSWQTISGFKQQSIGSIENADYDARKKWHFPNVPVQKIRVTLVQHHPVTIEGKTVFILGAQEIGVSLSMFEPSGGIILTPFEMDGIYNIESVDHVFLNRNAFSYGANMDHLLDGEIFEYEIYVEEPDQTLRPILNSDWTSQMAKRVWVKTHLHPDPYNGVNPCLHAVRLHYTKV